MSYKLKTVRGMESIIKLRQFCDKLFDTRCLDGKVSSGRTQYYSYWEAKFHLITIEKTHVVRITCSRGKASEYRTVVF